MHHMDCKCALVKTKCDIVIIDVVYILGQTTGATIAVLCFGNGTIMMVSY